MSNFMSTHRLVGAKQLAALPRLVDHDNLEVQCMVAAIHPTRAREFHCKSTVYNIEALDVVGKQPVHMFFYDEWATAASFMSVGDEVTLKGLKVCDVPPLPRTAEEADTHVVSPLGGGLTWFVTPCTEKPSALMVAQAAEQGDTIEVTVRPPLFEPTARVRKADKLSTKSSVLYSDQGATVAE